MIDVFMAEIRNADKYMLDVDEALKVVGTEAIFKETVWEYYRVIEEKADCIEAAVAREDYDLFTVEVHALKSASRVIGAQRLAKEAEVLEQCGKSGDFERIRKDTPALLKQYRAYQELFSGLFGRNVQSQISAPVEDIVQELQVMALYIREYEMDEAETIYNRLCKYELNSDAGAAFKMLGKAIRDFEYEAAINCIKELKKRWVHK